MLLLLFLLFLNKYLVARKNTVYYQLFGLAASTGVVDKPAPKHVFMNIRIM